MRVLHVDSGREWRGGQHQVWLLCRELARHAGVEQTLVTRQDSELARRVAADGAQVQGTTWEIGLDPRAWWQLRRAISSFHPDVIHVHDSHALTLAATVAMGRTLIATRRVDFHVGRFGAWRRPDRIIAVSAAVKQVLTSDGIAPDAVVVIPDGIDPEAVRAASTPPFGIRRQLKLTEKTPLAVNAAALVDHKDQRTLVRAADCARTLEPGLHWVIAGDGPLRGALHAEITRLGVADRVHLVGYIDRVDALITEASVFVMSSKEEGFGSVLLNALALGRPIVATAAGGIPEVLPAEVLVPVGASEALAQRVVDALHSPTVLPFPPRFTASAVAGQVLEVYKALS
ncbi:MAG TPA: glycosyltransferase [Gemmatimonadales bacterium]|nr:glycosyltransferase [Gemmatimonadales bacterium]